VRGQEEGAEYVGRAFAEAIVSNLVQAKGLNVLSVPRPGELGGGGTFNQNRAARDLGAGRLITGSVTRDGEAVSASLSLVDATKNNVLWTSQEDSAEGDLSRLASSMARELAGALGSSLGNYYDDPTQNPTGSPEFLASPDLFETVGALHHGESPTALAASKRLVEAFPNEPDALFLRSEILLGVAWGTEASSPEWKAWEESLTAFERVDPNHPWVEVTLGKAMFLRFGEDHHERAYELYNEVLARDDLTPSARAVVLGLRGLLLRLMGDPLASLADLEEAVRLAPMLPFAQREMAATLVELDRLDEAVEHARQAVALNPNFLYQGYLAWALRRNGQLEEALNVGRLSVELRPDHYQNHFGLGDILAELEEWEEAAVHYGKACELTPRQDWCAAIAVALQRTGKDSEGARKAAAEAASLPETWYGAVRLFIYHALVGDRDQALRYLRRSCELDVAPSASIVEAARKKMPSLNGDPEFEAIIAEYEKRYPLKEEQDPSD